jgi:hypothetical protein
MTTAIIPAQKAEALLGSLCYSEIGGSHDVVVFGACYNPLEWSGVYRFA